MSVLHGLRRGPRRALLEILGVIALALGPLAPAAAQLTRSFPDTVALGQLTLGVFPAATLDQRAVVLGPGTRILDENNRIVLPASLAGTPRRVAYSRGALGEIQRIWLLTPLEWQTLSAQLKLRPQNLRAPAP